ncbi:MAG: branched-chain amino acid ABC transporter permease [Thermodesulfobacteriota bacterium]
MADREHSSRWNKALRVGLLTGSVAVLVALIGMVEAFSQRDIVAELLSMGHTLIFFVVVSGSFLAAGGDRSFRALALGGLAGSVASLLLGALVLLGSLVPLRGVFINASPVLFRLLSFGEEPWPGVLFLCGAGLVTGVVGGCVNAAPNLLKRSLTRAVGAVVGAGVLQDMLRPVLAAWGPVSQLSDLIFEANGLTIQGALGILATVMAVSLACDRKGRHLMGQLKRLPPTARKAIRAGWVSLLVGLLLVLPQMLGLFLSEVLTIVGLYVLLGLGLNIVVGFAGLLDLSYVAFFAIGSYTVAILTSPELGFFDLSFWAALPVAVVLGAVSGVLLGIPVLKMRGDYLAIATLGFGEIIRILVLSDFLRPWLGGAQGIGKIPKASLAGYELGTPQELYYLILAGCVLVGLVSWRLRDSRIGRAWMAVREDEDVAQAMGINLVAAKLLAFATGAAFSALSGAIFATKLGSVYPHSFNVMISINILCLIIVGGMGSIPGVIVGAAALVGLPELLREFAEYRLLVYGAALVAMMLLKPEGLWPEAVRKRELHEERREA